MRLIKTFVVHLYIDLEATERLCGDVRSIEELESHPFKNLLELGNLLLRFIEKLLSASKTLPNPESHSDV